MMMKKIAGSGVHETSGLPATFVVEYRIGIGGVHYTGAITLQGCGPSRLAGYMSWTRKTIPPGRALERKMRESIQVLDVEKLLAKVNQG